MYATTPGCGVNWRRPTCSESRCPRDVGGSGRGFVELALLLAEVGWSVAPVPAYATLLLGADTIARYGDEAQRKRYLPAVIDGSSLLTAGLAEPGRSDPTRPATTARRDGDGWRLDGTKELVPAAQLAHTILIPASLDDGDVGVFLVDADSDGVEIRPVVTTNGEPHADVILDGAQSQPIGSPVTAERSSNRSMRVHLSGCARSNSA